MALFPQPLLRDTTVYAALPDAYRRPGAVTEWSRANRPGGTADCFLEGPCPAPDGSLHLVDIPHGRVFRLDFDRAWHLVAEYDGEPNGLARHPDGRLFIADYRHGLLALDPASGRIAPVLARRNSERFKGVNDLAFARNGDLYFTDQGQTGLHDPTGRVFRLRADGRLDCLLDNGPSPNGLALSADEEVLYVAMTRDNAVWRLPLLPDGGTAKVGRFASFHGPGGPDGMKLDATGRLLVAVVGLGAVFVLGPHGETQQILRSCRGAATTNLALAGGEAPRVLITESETGSVLAAPWPP